MALPASDNFNRANENPLAGNWTTAPGASAMQLFSNQVTGSTGANCTSFWNADTFGNDQYSQVTPVDNTNFGAGLAVRVRTTTQYDCYILFLNASGSVQIYKIIAGSVTLLSSPNFAYAAGDVIKLEAVGTTLTAYKNGVAQANPATDSALTAGAAGLFANNFNLFLDDWEGGNVTTGATYPQLERGARGIERGIQIGSGDR
jgi:hypothetical protein